MAKKKKTSYNPLYYYPNKLFSYDPKKYYYYICIGSRGRGKTVSAWRWVLKRYLKYGEQFIWLRLTEAPIKKASRNQGTTLVPEFLLKQLKIEGVTMRGSVIYMTVKEKGKTVSKQIGMMDSISTFYTSKGQDMSRYTNVIFDEINRESGERNTFDLTRAFINQIETIARMRTMRVMMLGNTISDTSEILGLFNFQPKKFGLYKLSRKHCIIEYLEDSEDFKKKRKKSLAGILLGDNQDVATSFTNTATNYNDNVFKYNDKLKQVFIFYIGEFKAYGIYSMAGLGKKYNRDGLYIGEIRTKDTPAFKLSPFLNCEGKYDRQIYDAFYELVSTNSLYFETTLDRSRFIKALKNNTRSLM